MLSELPMCALDVPSSSVVGISDDGNRVVNDCYYLRMGESDMVHRAERVTECEVDRCGAGRRSYCSRLLGIITSSVSLLYPRLCLCPAY